MSSDVKLFKHVYTCNMGKVTFFFTIKKMIFTICNKCKN